MSYGCLLNCETPKTRRPLNTNPKQAPNFRTHGSIPQASATAIAMIMAPVEGSSTDFPSKLMGMFPMDLSLANPNFGWASRKQKAAHSRARSDQKGRTKERGCFAMFQCSCSLHHAFGHFQSHLMLLFDASPTTANVAALQKRNANRITNKHAELFKK